MSTTPQLAEVATVTQLRTAIKLEPRPEPDRTTTRETDQPRRSRKTSDEALHHLADHPAARLEAAKFDAALESHRDALIAEWKHDHDRRAARRPNARRRSRTPWTRS